MSTKSSNPKTKKRYPPAVAGAHGNALRMPNGKLAVQPGLHMVKAEAQAAEQARLDYYAALPETMALHPDHTQQFTNAHILIQECLLEEQKQRFMRQVLERDLREQVRTHYGVDLGEELNPYKLDLPNARLTRGDPSVAPPTAAVEDTPADNDGDNDADNGDTAEERSDPLAEEGPSHDSDSDSDTD